MPKSAQAVSTAARDAEPTSLEIHAADSASCRDMLRPASCGGPTTTISSSTSGSASISGAAANSPTTPNSARCERNDSTARTGTTTSRSGTCAGRPGTYLLPEVVATFQWAHPGVHVSIATSPTQCLISQVSIETSTLFGSLSSPRRVFDSAVARGSEDFKDYRLVSFCREGKKHA